MESSEGRRLDEAKLNIPESLHSDQSIKAHYYSDDSYLPRNWPAPKKWAVTMILSSFAFIQPLSETMLAPLQRPISADLSISHHYQWILVNSLILIGVGFGPLFIAPLSEIYGRKIALLGGSVIFILWNTCCGFASNLSQMLAFRLLAGFGSCTADAVAGGIIGDIWAPQQRGTAFAVFMAAPLVGPGVGPIVGAYISEGISWRWAFWMASIICAVALVVAVFFLEETYAPVLVQRRCRSRHNMSTSEQDIESGIQKSPKKSESVSVTLWDNFQRPLRMLATQLIIQLIAVYMALLYGTMFLFLYMYSDMWIHVYGQSIRGSSLNYISAAIGYVAGVQVAGFLSDKVYCKLKASSANGKGLPEFRVPVMAIGTILIPIGLLWWGWTGANRLHWILPNIGCIIYTFGCYICSSCVSVYIIDAYTTYAASAVSTNLFLRSCFAALFPLFGPYMFKEVGFGYGATILAAGFSVVGFGTVFVLWFWGERIRAKSQFCAASDEE